MSLQDSMVAVTGAGGFIGSHVVEELLASGRRVRALVHYNSMSDEGHLAEVRRRLKPEPASRLEVLAGDVSDARCMGQLVRGCDTVFHLAALIGIPYSYIAPQSYVSTNIVGTLNLLEACRSENVPLFVHTSTSEVYGTALTTPMSEAHALQAQSPYAATKIAADKLVESYYLSFDFPAVILRPFNTYGPRQSMRAVIPTIIAQAFSNSCPSIRLGALDPVRDLTHVRDTARAYRMVAECPREKIIGRLYNLGVGRGLSIGSLAQVILDTLKIEKPIEAMEERVRPSRSEVRCLISDNHLVRHEVGWKPQISLEEGIKDTAEWVKEHMHLFNPEAYIR